MLRCHHHRTLVRYFNSNRLSAALAAFVTLYLSTVTFRAGLLSVLSLTPSHGKALEARDSIIASALAYTDAPLPSSAFGEMGNRTKMLTDWMKEASSLRQHLSRKETSLLTTQLEDAVVSMYPFLKNPMDPDDPLPFTALRKNIIPGSRGIVIAFGKLHFRYTLHLIANIRNVLRCNLPIQVMYAGNDDLLIRHRDILTSMFRNVETLDLLTVFDDTTIDLRHGRWAIKSSPSTPTSYSFGNLTSYSRATRATDLKAHYSTTVFSGRSCSSIVPNGGEKRWAIAYLVTLYKSQKSGPKAMPKNVTRALLRWTKAGCPSLWLCFTSVGKTRPTCGHSGRIG